MPMIALIIRHRGEGRERRGEERMTAEWAGAEREREAALDSRPRDNEEIFLEDGREERC